MKLLSTKSFKGLLIFAIIVSLLSIVSFAVYIDPEDTRTVINRVDGITVVSVDDDTPMPFEDVFVYGEDATMINAPFIYCTNDDNSQAYFYHAYWEKYIEDQNDWYWAGNLPVTTFTEGTWRYIVSIYLDNDDDYVEEDTYPGLSYRLYESGEVYVNGEDEPWKIESYDYEFDISGDPDYNYTCLTVYKQFEMDAPDYVVFPDLFLYDIPVNYVNVEIDQVDVSEYVEGGTAPYTFSKVSGPEWIEVSEDGIISGTPTEATESNEELVVMVEDDGSTSATVTISVAETKGDPTLRTPIHTITATSDNIANVPVIGASVYSYPAILVTEGYPAYFYEGTWQIKVGDDWYDTGDDVFEEGESYRYKSRIYIDNDGNYTFEGAGDLYVLADDLTVTLNGLPMELATKEVNDETVLDLEVEPGYSKIYSYSPAYEAVTGTTPVAGLITMPRLFEDAEVGYSSIDPALVYIRITTASTPNLSDMSYELTGDSEAFEVYLYDDDLDIYGPDFVYGEDIFTIKPVDGLEEGNYEATLALWYDSDGDETPDTSLGSVPVSFTVTEASSTSGDTLFEANVSSIEFDSLPAGFSGTEADAIMQTVTFTNTGSTTITITVANPTGDGPFGNVGYDTSTEIEPGESLDISLVPSTSSPYADTADTYEGTYVFTATNVEDNEDTATINIPATITLTYTDITSIVLGGTYTAPVVGEAIPELTNTITSVNGNEDLSGILNIESLLWRKRTGDGFWDFDDATGTFESGESYIIEMLFEIPTSEQGKYQFTMTEADVTFDDFDLILWQLNNTSQGVRTEDIIPTAEAVPETYTITIDPNNGGLSAVAYYSNKESGDEIQLGTVASYDFTAPENMEFDYYEDGAGNHYDVYDFYTVTGDDTITVQWKSTAVTPTTYTITLDPNNEIDGLSYFSDLESGETLILGSVDSYSITAPDDMEFDYYEDGAGNQYDVGDTYTVTGDDTITVHWKATTPALTTINAISVAGVALPVAGQTPTTSAVINTEGITSGSAQWDNIDGTFIEGNFVAGTTYRIKIEFTIDEGYEVSPTATIGANEDPDDTQLNLSPIDNWIGLIYTVPEPLAPTGSITIPTFDDAVEGYAAIEDKPITIAITNAYTVSPANLDFTITGANPDDFIVDLDVFAGNMEGPNTWSLTSPFSVKPDAGLTEGTYTATITLLYDADGDDTYETTIGSGDVSFTVTAAAPTLYTVTVAACGYGDVKFSDGEYTHGSDSKQLPEGTEVTVEALPYEGYALTEWTDDEGNVLSTNTSYTFEVGTEDIELIASFEELFTITVVNGSADYDEAIAGTIVTITADAPEEGKMFDCWDCDNEDVFIDDYYEPETTFEMPDSDVEITAVYMDIPSGDITWTVSDGTFELTEENETVFSFWFEYATDVEDGLGLLKLVIDEENDIYYFYDLDDKLLFTMTEISYSEDSTEYEIEIAEGVTSGDNISYVFTQEDKDDFAELSFYDGANLIFDVEEPTESGNKPIESGEQPTESGEEPAPIKPTTSSSSSAKSYKITTKISNGTITPSNPKVDKKDDQTFKFKASDGYEIVDVLVDGKSVGKVSEYTLENVTKKHTIEVKTEKVEKSSTSNPADKFTDVKKNDWFYDYVNYVVEKGLFVGTTETTFSPNKNLTRGMLVTILYRFAGATDTAKATFDDVDPNEYYSAPIAWAAKNGYVNGIGDNKFDPDANITRQDLATIIYRYIKAQGKGFTGMWMFLLQYDDKALIDEYAYEPICWLTMNDVLAGKGDNKIDPLGYATRAETAKIMQIVSELLK